MTFEEIVAKLEELEITPEGLVEGCQTNYIEDEEDEDLDEEIEINVTNLVKEHFGTVKDLINVDSGDGSNGYNIQHFVDHNVYIKVEYWYTSYDGNDYSDSEFIEVYPAEHTVTVYKQKNGQPSYNILTFTV